MATLLATPNIAPDLRSELALNFAPHFGNLQRVVSKLLSLLALTMRGFHTILAIKSQEIGNEALARGSQYSTTKMI
jgi:hypothetical protein